MPFLEGGGCMGFTSIKTAFSTARDSQVETKGDLAQARAREAATRPVLELQLGRNILAIASQFLGQTAQAAIYFNQSLLEDPTRNNEDTPLPPVVG
jgi:hypothetical protein